MGDIISVDNINSTISVSRTFQEALEIRKRESKYAILAGLLEVNQDLIDQYAQSAGNFAAYLAVSRLREQAYANSQKSMSKAVKNTVNKNLYQSQITTSMQHQKQKLAGQAVAATTEWMIKKGAEQLYRHAAQKANFEAISRVYGFLNNYAINDRCATNQKRAGRELAKIRNGLPLTAAETQKLIMASRNSEEVQLEDISRMPELTDTNLCETIAYHLFNLYCQKYGDDESRLAEELANRNYKYNGIPVLLEYYDYLGFTGQSARELLRENANRYDQISRDQNQYLRLGRLITRELALNIPSVDVQRVTAYCERMALCDPYQLRRKKVQTTSLGVAETLGGILMKDSNVVSNGLSLALSQFDLEDGNLWSIVQQELSKNGIDQNMFEQTLSQSKQVKDKAKETAKLEQKAAE